ncbi:c-type cytochrome [Chachezhania sediminis]|uniref:c-type cytochrome n=1 Tax=Chachezhania sediminis TaxID=2599291 RepID=UPI00131DC246|nr:c-type cytochrome [Chachezhania sediminis]
MLRLISGLIFLGVVGLLGFGVFILVWGVPRAEERPTLTAASDIQDGQYLVQLGDCASCHTAEGKADELAGGYPMETPFGTIYSPNITPDKKTGIGNLTSAEFYQLIAYGADSIWAPLYPAMPYTSFHNVDRDDSDKIFAYLQSLKPVDRPQTPNEMGFPFNIRPAMFGWDFLFASREPFQPTEGKDDVWNRGKWIVEGLGHCGECHTPRNALGAMKTGKDDALSGAVLGALEAPDIRPAALAERGWTREDLIIFLQTGAAPQGSAFGEMFLAVKNSFRHMTSDDLKAVSTFLMDVPADEPTKGEKLVAAMGDKADPNKAGQALFLSNCSVCHGDKGQGVQGAVPALMGNSTLGEPGGRNLVSVVTNGIEPQQADASSNAYGQMPSFGDRFSLEQMTDLANFVRANFAPDGASLTPLTQAEVAANQ